MQYLCRWCLHLSSSLSHTRPSSQIHTTTIDNHCASVGSFPISITILLKLFSGMMGQYPFSAFVGKVIDEYGPWACSLIASLLFSSGYAIVAAEIAKTPDDITEPSESSFRILAVSFFMMSLGSATSCVSSSSTSDLNLTSRIAKLLLLSLCCYSDIPSMPRYRFGSKPGTLWPLSSVHLPSGIHILHRSIHRLGCPSFLKFLGYHIWNHPSYRCFQHAFMQTSEHSPVDALRCFHQ
jgi:hypothetical protein